MQCQAVLARHTGFGQNGIDILQGNLHLTVQVVGVQDLYAHFRVGIGHIFVLLLYSVCQIEIPFRRLIQPLSHRVCWLIAKQTFCLADIGQ